jgi:tetratricopeptide (TPR) repeat protein
VQAAEPQLAHDVYRPLTTFSFALSYHLWGYNPHPYHALNVLLHALNGVLVFFLLFFLLPKPSERAPPSTGRARIIAAFVAACLFVIHPVQTEAVAWISQRSTLLSQSFFLLALLAYLRHRLRPHPAAFVAALLGFTLSLLCKESALVYPAIVLLLDWYLQSREVAEPSQTVKAQGRAWLLPAASFAVAAGYVLTRSAVLGQVAQTHYWAGGLYRTCLLMTKGFAYYLRLLFIPHPLSIEYLFEVPRTAADPLVLMSASVLVAAGYAAWKWRKDRAMVSLGIAWFFVSLAPVSNIIPIRTIINERFLYLPIIGLCLAAAHMVAAVLGKTRRLKPLMAFIVAFLAIMSLLSVQRSKDWSSGYALASSALRTCPQSAHIRYGMGRQYAERGELDQALKEFELALSIDPAYHEALNDIGLIAQRRGDLNAALAQYRKTLQAKVDYPQALCNMGNVYFAKHDYVHAAKSYEAALKLKPGDQEIESNLAAAYAYGGDMAKAVDLSLALLKEEPGRTKTRYNLALYYGALGLQGKAEEQLRIVLKTDPAHKPAVAELQRIVDARQEEALLEPRESKVAAMLRERFMRLDPRLRLQAEGEYEAVKDKVSGEVVGVRPKAGYRGSAQAGNALNSEERQALAALAAKEGKKADAEKASFLFPVEYGTPYVIQAGKAAVRVKPLHANKARLSNVNGLVAYEGAFRGTDVLFNANEDSAEEFLLLEDASAPKTFEYSIAPEGAVASLALDAGGNLKAQDGAGKQLFALSAPVVFDSKGKTVKGRFSIRPRSPRDFILAMTFDDKGMDYPLLIDPTWTTAGASSMSNARQQHTATLLPNGKVLVAGGYYSPDNGITSIYLSSAELYDPVAGSWTTTGYLNAPREYQTATLLPNGQVLVVGGLNSGGSLASAEIYNPATGVWTSTGSLNSARYVHTATLLPNGKVLVAGGYSSISGGTFLSTAELYDPVAGSWTTTGPLNSPRENHTATLLSNGKVLVAGGYNNIDLYLSTAELYDPVSRTWAPTGPMTTKRTLPSATLLPNGKVLVAGGETTDSPFWLSSAELYDPSLNTWTATGPMNYPRGQQTAILLPNGNVLVAGGTAGSAGHWLSSAEIYDSTAGSWATTGSLFTARDGHTGTLLPNGKVLVAGGAYSSGYLSSAELYDPSAGSWAGAGVMAAARYEHTATLLPNGKVLVAGGYTGSTYLSGAELYNPSAGTWTTTSPMNVARAQHTATLLPNGKVLVAGGAYSSGCLSSAELYDPSAGSWATTNSLASARMSHTATLLPSGKVLVAGGGYPGGYLSGAELYDPAAGSWTTTGSLNSARDYHTATLLSNGKVLVAGGYNPTILSAAELYDPAAGSWTTTSSLNSARYEHTATLLPNGKVLVAGGLNGSCLSSAEIYDPSAETFTTTNNLISARDLHSATLLPNGKVLVAGGYNGSALSSAETYDPASGFWTAAGTMASTRYQHTATLLPNGEVLAAGGLSGSPLSSAELILYSEYDFNISTKAFLQPKVTTINGLGSFPVTLNPGNSDAVTGTTFTGMGEASGGNGSESSPTNYPRIYMMPNDSGNNGAQAGSEQLVDVSNSIYGATEQTNYQNNQSATNLSFSVPPGQQCGYYQLSVMANAIPSPAAAVLIVPPAPASGPSGVNIANVFISSITIQWTLDPESGVAGYLARACLDSGCSVVVSTGFTTTPTATSVTVAGLASNTTYYCQIAAENCGGLGTFSAAGSTTTQYGPPGPPGFVAVSPVYLSTDSLVVQWGTGSNGGSPQYQADISSTSDFLHGYISSVTPNTSATFGEAGLATFLAPNTTYYVRVKVFSGSGSAYNATVASTSTFAVPPVMGAFVTPSSYTVTANWTAGQDGPVLSYQAVISTNANFAPSLATTTWQVGVSTTFSAGINPNTQYWVAVRARGNNGDVTALSIAASTTTQYGPPGAPSFSAVSPVYLSTDSLVVQWGTGGNGGSPQYQADISSDTSGNFSYYFSSITYNTSATFGEAGLAAFLNPNTTYYARVKVFSGSAYNATVASTSTFAVPPVMGAFVTPSSYTVTANWTAGQDGPVLSYQAVISTNANFAPAVATTTWQSGLSATFSAGINPNTQYWVAVRALGNNGDVTALSVAASTTTQYGPPGAPSFSAVSPVYLSTDSLIVQWGTGNNGGSPQYQADISSDISGNFSYYFSSITYNTSTTFGEAGLAAFLKPNTTYYARVKVFSGSGSAYNTTQPSTSTFAAPPAAPTFVSPSSYTVTANWTAGQDGPILSYQAVISTNANFAPALATTTWQSGASATFATGINPDTQYWVAVRALGNNGDVTALSVAASTTTQYGPPGPPSFSAVSPVYLSTDSLIVQWGTGGNGGSPQYQADISSDTSGNFSYYFSSITYNTSATFGEAGLAASLNPNTTYYARVKVFSGSGSAYNTTQPSTSTFAAPPAAPTFVSPSSYTVTANWTAGQDGPILSYQAVISTNANFAPALATTTWQSGASATFATGINPDTQYWVAVRALGNNGDVTALSVAASTTTQYGPPGAPSFSAVSPVYLSTDSLVVQWGTGGNGGSPQYQADISSDPSGNFSYYFSSVTYNTSATFGEAGLATFLNPNTTYYARVKVFSGSGSAYNTTQPSTSTFAAPPAAPTFVNPSSYTVTAQWGSSNGPVATSQAVISTNANFAPALATTTWQSGASATFATGINPGTQYWVAVRVLGNNGDITAWSAAASTTTQHSPPGPPSFVAVSPVYFSTDSVVVLWGTGGNGSGTQYQADISSDPSGNFSYYLSSVTYNTSATFGEAGLATFLNPNTTYYARVKVFSGSAYNTTQPSTSTFAAPPAAPTFVNPSSYTVTAQWGSSNGPVATFQAVISTNTNFAPTLATTTWQSGASATFATGINPETQYWVAVRALGNNGDITAWSAAASTTTQYGLPGPPSFAAVSPVYLSTDSLVVQWNSGGNGGSPQYQADISSDPSGNFNYYFSSVTYNTSATFGEAGLAAFLHPNTTYYARVGVISGGVTAYNTTQPSTSTFAAPPAAPTFVSPSSYTVTAQWGSSNGPVATFQAVISTNANFAPALATTTLVSTSTIFSAGLSPNTTYWVAVRAIGNNGDVTAWSAAASTTTQHSPPDLPSFVAVSPVCLSTDSLVVQWGTGGNGSGTQYQADISSDPSGNFSYYFSSVTFSTSATFGEAGLAAFLHPNATYYARVKVFSGSGSVYNTTQPSTSTFAAPPAVPTFLSPSSYTVTAQWSSNNGPVVAFQAVISTNANFAPALATTTWQSGVSAFFSAGINPGTQYWVAVRALGNNGDITAWSAAASTTTQYGLSRPPSFVAVFPVSLSTDSLVVQWGTGGNGGSLQYQADISSDPSGNFNYYFSSVTFNTSATFGEAGGVPAAQYLKPNTTYYAKVKVANDGFGNSSPFTPPNSTSTFVAAPIGPAIVSVSSYSVTAQWSDSLNGPAVSYLAELATNSGFNPILRTAATTGQSATFTGLNPLTQYWVEVQAVGNRRDYTAFTSGVSTYTLSPPPTGLAGTAQGVSSITWTWSALSGVTGFNFYPSTGGLISLSTTSWTQTGLSTNTQYGGRVTAQSLSGESAKSAQAFKYTLAMPPANLQVILSTTVISSSLIAASWSPNTDPYPSTATVFLLQASTDPVGYNPTAASSQTLNDFAQLTGLNSNTSYYLRVQALNGDGTATAFAVGASTHTPLPPQAVQTFWPGQQWTSTETFFAAAGPVTLTVPPGAFSSTVTITIQTPLDLPLCAAVPGLTETGIMVEILTTDGIEPLTSVGLSMGYGGATLPPGMDSAQLVLAYCDQAHAEWVPLFSAVDTYAKTVSAMTPHLSYFQVMQQAPSGSVSSVQVSNNPFRPRQGQQTMDFRDVPAGARLRVYTMRGELVKDLDSDASGMASWDGTNQSGRSVASGVYLVLIQGSGQANTIKVAVER